MSNYKIEGNIDFYAELYKSLDDTDENVIVSTNDENKCLITDSPLTDKFVTMKCGHKFNYEPLYKDILNHKQKFNSMESSKSTLKMNEIRCPYCRKVQTELLPYYEELGFPKKNGVNYFDPKTIPIHSLSNPSSSQKCEFEINNPYYDSTKPESSSNVKMVPCGKYFSYPICVYIPSIPVQSTNYNDTKCYCYTHNKMMVKKYKQETKEKEKQAKLEAKLTAKLEKEKAKLEAKQAKMLTKQSNKKPKTVKTTNVYENVVLGNITIGITTEKESNEVIGCVQILKSGPNKGKPCGCKIFNENKCKRHYQIPLPLLENPLLEKVEQK